MVAGRSKPLAASRCVAGVLVFAFGTAAVFAAAPQTDEELVKLRLQRLLLEQQRLRELQALQAPPKGQPKTPPKPLPAASGGMPEGAIARLGDSRLRHAAPPSWVVFAPDGKRVFTGGEDATIRVWAAATGESLNTLKTPEGQGSARFSADGKKLVVSFSDGRLRFLNADTLAEQSNTTFAIGGEFALSPDGSFLATFNGSGYLAVTELATGLPKLELPAATPFAFHPGGKTIAVADKDGKVTVYMLAGGKPIGVFEHGAAVKSFAFSPDGKQLATGDGKLVRVWDFTNPKKPLAEIPGAGKPRVWIDNNRLAAGDGFTAGVYDIKAGKWIGQVKGVAGDWAISPDGSTIASTGTGGLRVRMFDVTTGKQLHADNDTFPEAALLAPSADGKSVFVIAGDAAFHWPIDKTTATPAGTLPGKALVAATGGGKLAVALPNSVVVYEGFDPAKPLPAKPARTISDFADNCRSLAVSPDGKKIAYSGDSNRIVIADAAKGTVIRMLPTQTTALALAFSPDSSNLSVIGRDGFFRLWSADAVKEGEADTHVWSFRIQRGIKGSLAFSPDGKQIVASSSGTFKVVSAADGSEVFSAGGIYENGIFQQLAFSPDGKFIVAASEGSSGGVTVWDVGTQSLARRFTTGFGTVTSVSVFADGKKAISAGAEEVLTVWDLSGVTPKK